MTSRLAIGTVQFGMDYGIANQNGKVNANQIQSILDFAHEKGINVLDTAKAYGNSEKSIGNYLKLTKKTEEILSGALRVTENIKKCSVGFRIKKTDP